MQSSGGNMDRLKKKLNCFEHAVFQFVAFGYCEEIKLMEACKFAGIPFFKRGEIEDWIQYIASISSNIILVSTFRPIGLIPFLNTVFRKKQEDHIRILGLTEEDKSGILFILIHREMGRENRVCHS